jgi:hypothetical protein
VEEVTMGRKKKPKAEDAAAAPAAPSNNPVATFDTSMGSFRAEIFADRVPRTASNFIDLAQSGFYDGLHFHRVIPVRQAPSHLLPSPPVLPSLFGCAAGTTRRPALPLGTA